MKLLGLTKGSLRHSASFLRPRAAVTQARRKVTLSKHYNSSDSGKR